MPHDTMPSNFPSQTKGPPESPWWVQSSQKSAESNGRPSLLLLLLSIAWRWHYRSPDMSPSPPGGSLRRSCSGWSWSSSSTSSLGRCSRRQTSAQATGCSCWSTSRPSRSPCNELTWPVAESPPQAAKPAPLWRWWSPGGPAESERKYVVSSVIMINETGPNSVDLI